MDAKELNLIIFRKNEGLEREALREAEQIIENIAKYQGIIADSQDRIIELRANLKALQVKRLDASAILGGE